MDVEQQKEQNTYSIFSNKNKAQRKKQLELIKTSDKIEQKKENLTIINNPNKIKEQIDTVED